jgi:hypothetical protein
MLWTWQWIYRYHKWHEICRRVERLTASKEERCSLEKLCETYQHNIQLSYLRCAVSPLSGRYLLSCWKKILPAMQQKSSSYHKAWHCTTCRESSRYILIIHIVLLAFHVHFVLSKWSKTFLEKFQPNFYTKISSFPMKVTATQVTRNDFESAFTSSPYQHILKRRTS